MSESGPPLNLRDVERLRSLVPGTETPFARGTAHLRRLARSVYDGVPVQPSEVPPDVVTMNSIVSVRNLESGEISTYRLVFPQDADMKARSLSVLAPVGAALFGRRVGECFDVPVPSGQTRRLEVVQIVFQPEAAGLLE